MVVTAILLALGVTPNSLLVAAGASYGVALPWFYVAGAQVACFVAAVLLMGRALYKQLQLELPFTPAVRRLFARPHVSFGEIAARLSEAHPEYTPDEITHRLMKAYWRGEFERDDGTGLVFHQGSGGLRVLEGGGAVHLKGPHDQPHRDADPDPDKIAYGRRVMAFRDDVALSRFYPSVFELRTQFNDTEYSWAALKRQVDWRIFAMIPPSQYSEDFKRIWVGELMLPRRLFVRWYRRFRQLRYED